MSSKLLLVSGAEAGLEILVPCVGLLLVAGLQIVIVAMVRRGGLPLNAELGIRTRKTRASKQAWEAGHRAAVPTLIVGAATSVSAIALSLVLALTGGSSAAWIVLGAGYLAAVTLLIAATIAANRAADQSNSS